MTASVRVGKDEGGDYRGLPKDIAREISRPLRSFIDTNFSKEVLEHGPTLVSPAEIKRGSYIDIKCRDKTSALKVAFKIKKFLDKRFSDEFESENFEFYIGVSFGRAFKRGEYKSIKDVFPNRF